MHRDIKGSNLLLGRDGDVRIGDLGCASRLDGAAESAGLAGTPLFMAPEVARGQSQGCPADVWALGCTLVEMATGSPPWAGEVTDPVSALYRIGCTDTVPEVPENLSEEGQDFLGKCFRRNPSERWTAEQLLRHPFVGRVEETEIARKPVCDSPKSILDRDFWDSLQNRNNQTGAETNEFLPVFAPAPAVTGRIKALFSPASRRPDWSCGENWLSVRAKAPENLSAPSVSGGPDLELPAAESTTGREVEDDPIWVEKSVSLNDGEKAKVNDGQSWIDNAIDPLCVKNKTVLHNLIKMKVEISLKSSLPLYICAFVLCCGRVRVWCFDSVSHFIRSGSRSISKIFRLAVCVARLPDSIFRLTLLISIPRISKLNFEHIYKNHDHLLFFMILLRI